MEPHVLGQLLSTADVICHCRTEEQAIQLRAALEERLSDCGLKLHPGKTKIVYCKDGKRGGNYPQEKFDFQGFTFRPRLAKSRWGNYFISFGPAVSDKAAKKMSRQVRSWKLHLRSDKALDDLARMFNPVILGWDKLLWQLLQVCTVPDISSVGSFPCKVGRTEIQKVTET